MVPDLKTFAYKVCKIAAQNKFFLLQILPYYQDFFYRCYSPHMSRDSLSLVRGIFLVKSEIRLNTSAVNTNIF